MEQQLILFGGSLVAILILSGLARALFPTKAQLDDAACHSVVQRCYPGEQISDIIYATDHRIAIVRLQNQRLCAVLAMGSGNACRLLSRFRFSQQGARFALDLNDYSMPSLSFQVSADDKATLRTWLDNAKTLKANNSIQRAGDNPPQSGPKHAI